MPSLNSNPLLKYLAIGIGGFLGSITRYWLGAYVSARMGTRFPYGTFVINISACFLVGFVMTILTARTHMSEYWRFLLPIGFIGAYSTFSAWEYDIFTAARVADPVAFLNIACSIVFGFLAVWLGTVSGKAVLGGPPSVIERQEFAGKTIAASGIEVIERAHRAAAGAGPDSSRHQ